MTLAGSTVTCRECRLSMSERGVVHFVGCLLLLVHACVGAGGQRHRRGCPRHVRSRAARRHGGSRQPGADREGPQRRHRRGGPLQHHRAAARHLHGHVHGCPASRTVRREGIELSAGLHRDRQCRSPGRIARGDDHGQRRDADRRHARTSGGRRSPRASCSTRCRPAPRTSRRWSRSPRDGPASRRRRPLHRRGRRLSTASAAPRCRSTAWASRTAPATAATSSTRAVVEEMVLQTSGISAEINADGPVMNIIPKEGGNTFRFIGNGLFTNHHLESDNLTDELRDPRPARTSNKTYKIFDESASVGGPIKQDKLWFFGGAAHLGDLAADCRRLLEQDPGRAPDAARRGPRSRAAGRRGSIGRSTRLSGRWEWYDSAWPRSRGRRIAKQQVQRASTTTSGRATAAVDHAGERCRRRPADYQVRAEPAGPGDLELAAHEPAAARSRCRRVRFRSGMHYWHPGVRPDIIRITDVGTRHQLRRARPPTAAIRTTPNRYIAAVRR